MANNYVQMSEQYDLNPEQVKWFQDFLKLCEEFLDLYEDGNATQLARLAKILTGTEVDGNDESVLSELEDQVSEATGQIDLNVKEKTIWFADQDGEYVNVNMVCNVLTSMLEETNDSRVLTGTTAETCSKPRVGEFGGGWYAVSATEIRSGNSWDAAAEAAEEMAKQ